MPSSHTERQAMKNILFVCGLLVFLSAPVNAGQWKAVSPDGSLSITLDAENGKLTYAVSRNGESIIGSSPLGIVVSGDDFSKGLQFISTTSKKIDEQYTMLIGKQLKIHAQANQTSVYFTNTNNHEIEIELRAYNDGAAFRYNLKGNKEVTVEKELTAFNVGEGNAWLQPYGLPSWYAPVYEIGYTNNMQTGAAAPDSSGWGLPGLFKTNNNHWLLITEANLDTNYCGSHFNANSQGGMYTLALPMQGEASGMYDANPTAKLPFSTPWRVIITGENQGTIVESNLVYNLSDANKLGDVSWVKPGRSSWSWWSDHGSSRQYKPLARFVDFGKEIGWEYSLVDANWNVMEGGNIEELIAYAKSKNVGLSLWYNSAGPYNGVTEQPRDRMFDAATRKAEFKKLHDWGIKAVKVDFFGGEKQKMMKQYIGILNDAAAEHVMVIFHGCTIPRGWSRTYPNLLSMEGIRGAEQYGSKEFALAAPAGNTVNVFTRNAIGPMDYTPVTFTSPYEKHITTNTHELALSIVFESGMFHFADSDSSYKAQKPEVFEFLSEVPNTWDETKFIQGEPGKDVVLARRKGNTWYVAGINGEATAKRFDLDLSFIKGNIKATLFTDGAPDEIKVSTMDIGMKKATVPVLPNGGFVMVLKP